MARVEYIKPGVRNLRNEDKVLDLLEEMQAGIETETEIKHSNKCRNNNNFRFNDDTSTRNDNNNRDNNWCRKKDHNHLWKSCPDNPELKKMQG